MHSKGYVKGNSIILHHAVAVPDGTEVEVVIPSVPDAVPPGPVPRSVAETTFGMLRADPSLVRLVLEDELYDT